MDNVIYNLCEGCRKDLKCSECRVFFSQEKMRYLKRLLDRKE